MFSRSLKTLSRLRTTSKLSWSVFCSPRHRFFTQNWCTLLSAAINSVEFIIWLSFPFRQNSARKSSVSLKTFRNEYFDENTTSPSRFVIFSNTDS